METKADKPGLLVVASTYPRWANDTLPRFVADLSERLNDYFEVSVLVPHAKGLPKFERMNGCNIYRYQYFFENFQALCYEGGMTETLKNNPLCWFQVPFFLLFQVIATVRLISRLRPSAMHAHWIIPQAMIVCVARYLTKHKAKVLVTSHGADLFGFKGKLFSWLKKVTLENVDSVAVVSDVMKDFIQVELGVEKLVHVQPMGVDFSLFSSAVSYKSNQKLLFVGRLVEKKGVSVLLHAVALISEKYPDMTLDIYGDGPEKTNLRNLSSKLNINDRVFFRGAATHKELVEQYANASAVVVPSIVSKSGDQEGLGLVTIEAMGCGATVIVSDLPAIKDVVNPDCGYIFKSGDEKCLASSIAQCFFSPKEAEAKARAGQVKVRELFCWNKSVKVYSQLLLGKR